MLDGTERFMVTGASGWFGRAALDLLLQALGPAVFAERVWAYASTAKPVVLRDGTVVVAEPLQAVAERTTDATHVLHYAFLTRDRVAHLGVEAYVAGNLAVTDLVLGVIEQGTVRGFAYASSGAACRSAGTRSGGSVVDNPYGALKRIDELAFRQACVDIGASACTARVFGAGGAYMTKPEQFALGDFVSCATRGESLHVRATTRVFRSYTAVDDVVALQVAAILRPGRHDTTFDTGGEEVEVEELARRVVRVLGCDDLSIVRDSAPHGPDDRYVGDPAAMRSLAASLGVQLASLDEQIAATAAWLREAGTAGAVTPGGRR